MLDHGIKVEKGHDVYDSGTKMDVWIQTPHGKRFSRVCLLLDKSLILSGKWPLKE